MIEIAPVQASKDWTLFERIPEMLHRRNSYFVPPFPGSVSRIRKPTHPFHSHGKIYPFIARDAGRPVGRIAGIINETHNEHHQDAVGFFGFFDFIDDTEVVKLLFDAAEQEVARHGRKTMRGPYNPTQNDECGLLVDGFDSHPFVMMPYNPEYYVAAYDTLGLQKARDLYAFLMDDDTATLERTERIVERVKRKTQIAIRSVNLSNFRQELEIIEYLFNATLVREWGFMPTTMKDLEFAARDLKAILDPDMVLIAERGGEPVGFSLIIPNVNELMVKAAKSRGWLRLLRLAWYVKTQHPTTARLAVMGVLPEFRNKGIAPVFYFESLRRGKRKYVGGEISWVQDINEEITKTAALMKVERYKTYRIYEKPILA